MIYDYIIVGAGLGGLSAGINLAKNNKKVLIIEKNSLPGGLVTTFKRGRFEFDTFLYELYNFGDDNHVGDIKKIFEEYNVSVDTKLVPFNILIKTSDKEEMEIKGNIEEFFATLEQIKAGSIEPLKEFLKVIKDIHEAIKVLETDEEPSEDDYPYFYKYLYVNVIDALNDIGVSKEIISKLGFLWINIGSPLNKLSFIDFADFMYKLAFKKRVILNNKSVDLALKLSDCYRGHGGKIYTRTEVKEIDLEKNLVITSDNKEYKAKHIICDLMPRYVYTSLVKNDKKDINRLENARTIGASTLSVYIGLNKSIEELGLKHYQYYHYKTFDSDLNVKSMKEFKHTTWQAIVPNVVNENASPKNTTIIVLRTDYYEDLFSKVTKENYHQLKEELASNLIVQFECEFNIDIAEYIEEIEVITPITIERLTNNLHGSTKGYMRKGYDNAINRLISYNDEKEDNLSFVGSCSLFGNGFDNAIYSGYYVTEKLLNEGDHK